MHFPNYRNSIPCEDECGFYKRWAKSKIWIRDKHEKEKFSTGLVLYIQIYVNAKKDHCLQFIQRDTWFNWSIADYEIVSLEQAAKSVKYVKLVKPPNSVNLKMTLKISKIYLCLTNTLGMTNHKIYDQSRYYVHFPSSSCKNWKWSYTYNAKLLQHRLPYTGQHRLM